MVDIIVFICVMVIVVGIPVGWIIYALVNYRKLEDKRKARLARIREEQAARKKVQKPPRSKPGNVIVEVKYLGAGAVSQKRGGIGGAMLGGFFAGPIGAVVGAALPKNAEGLHRFAVRYANGRLEIKELHPNSWEYKKLIKMVKWEEL